MGNICTGKPSDYHQRRWANGRQPERVTIAVRSCRILRHRPLTASLKVAVNADRRPNRRELARLTSPNQNRPSLFKPTGCYPSHGSNSHPPTVKVGCLGANKPDATVLSTNLYFAPHYITFFPGFCVGNYLSQYFGPYGVSGRKMSR